MTRLTVAAAALAAAIALPALAQQSRGIEIQHPFAWISPSGHTGAAYARIHNNSGSDDRIVAVYSADARRVELHTHEFDSDGIARMRRLEEGILLPAREAVDLAPGGLHIMLMGLHQPPSLGDYLDVVLEMESGGETHLRAEVMQRGVRGGMHGDSMGHAKGMHGSHMDGMSPSEGMGHSGHRHGEGHGQGHMRYEYE